MHLRPRETPQKKKKRKPLTTARLNLKSKHRLNKNQRQCAVQQVLGLITTLGVKRDAVGFIFTKKVRCCEEVLIMKNRNIVGVMLTMMLTC